MPMPHQYQLWFQSSCLFVCPPKLSIKGDIINKFFDL